MSYSHLAFVVRNGVLFGCVFGWAAKPFWLGSFSSFGCIWTEMRATLSLS